MNEGVQFSVEGEAFCAPVVGAGAGTVDYENAGFADGLCLLAPIGTEASGALF